MLDFSKKRPRRRSLTVPAAVKLFFLLIPWAFIAYGLSMSKEFVYFYNNSVPANGTVVFLEPSHKPLSSDKLDALTARGQTWPLPSFLYVHENTEVYIGGPIADASRWSYQAGDVVEIAYNRAAPAQAQPMGLFEFWWPPAIFILGGLIAFIGLAIAFHVSENPDRVEGLFNKRRKHRLNLRRK